MARGTCLLLLTCSPLVQGLRSNGPTREGLLGMADILGDTQAVDYKRMWDTHLACIKRHDFGCVEKSYVTGATLLVHSTVVGGIQSFNLRDRPIFFKALFRETAGRKIEELHTDVRTDMQFGNNTKAGRVVRVWRLPSRGMFAVVETFILVGNGIIRHNFALDCRAINGKGCMTQDLSSVKPQHSSGYIDQAVSDQRKLSLGQHLHAFSGKTPVLTTVDYPLGSSMLLYDVNKQVVKKAKKTAGMQALTTELWSQLPKQDPSSLELDVGTQWAFNVYDARKGGCTFGTDTVILDFKGRFLDHSAVINCH